MSLRIPLRAMAFAASIALVFILPRADAQSRFHPALLPALCAIAIVALEMFHPQSNTLRARLATLAMYGAIVAPLIWVGKLRPDVRTLRAIVITLWAFSSLSALVGTVQTLRPDWQWIQPNLSSVVQNHDDGGDQLKISLASGAIAFRPMGLSDQPGAAAMAGLICILFGAALLAHYRNTSMWMLVTLTMTLGLCCILLSQLRSVLLMTGVCVGTLLFVMARSRDWNRLSIVTSALVAAIVIGATSAIMIGGASVTDRLGTLVQNDPRETYYDSRGHFLEYTFAQVIPQAPLGSGVGRWGMINFYFGAEDDAKSPPLYSEIMWTSWAYDGGVPLMLAYICAVGIAIWQSWKLAARATNDARQDIRLWAAMIFAFNIGCLAVTFNYPLFMGQTGLEFWLLNATLFAAFQTSRQQVRA